MAEAGGQRGHYSGRGHFANGVVIRIGDIEVARDVDGDPGGRVEAGGAAGAVGAAERSSQTRQGANGAGRRDLADGLVGGVGDKDIPPAIGDQVGRMVEAGRAAGAVGGSRASGQAGQRANRERIDDDQDRRRR